MNVNHIISKNTDVCRQIGVEQRAASVGGMTASHLEELGVESHPPSFMLVARTLC